MRGMFSYCRSLISLPDISKWNTSYVNDISGMFKKCNSLISLPDMSKWITYKVNNMSDMFFGCFNCLVKFENMVYSRSKRNFRNST